jgi:hypothetical protein
MRTYIKLRNRWIFRDMEMIHANLNRSDAVAAFPELGVVFNRIKKSGNSTVTAFLSELAARESGKSYDSVDEAKQAAVGPVRGTWAEASALRDYTYLTVVRNPYDRALSAFLNKVAPGEDGDDSRKPHFRCVPGWGEASREGFEKFVRFLDAGGLDHDKHWWPQNKLLIMPPARFDCIAKLETLAEDMARFLVMIGRDPAPAQMLEAPHPLESRQERKITGASAKRARFYTPELMAIVSRLYADDFELFDYPVDAQ